MATKKFDPEDFAGFLKLLPAKQGGVKLQHAVEVRHKSFRDPAFIAMARAAGVAIAFGDGDEFPCVADVSGDLIYARLMGAREDVETGYDAAELDRWAAIVRGWAAGESPPGLPYNVEPAPTRPRDTYVFFISGAKERNPAAAMALLERL